MIKKVTFKVTFLLLFILVFCALNDQLMDTAPIFTQDTIVFGLLMLMLGFVFYTSSSENKFWKKFYKYIPALLMAYMMPAALTTFGLIAP
jgi:hypothetical protein